MELNPYISKGGLKVRIGDLWEYTHWLGYRRVDGFNQGYTTDTVLVLEYVNQAFHVWNITAKKFQTLHFDGIPTMFELISSVDV